MKPHPAKKTFTQRHTRKYFAHNNKYLFVLFVLIVVAGIVALFSQQQSGKAVKQDADDNSADVSLDTYDTVSFPPVYCGMIPIATTTLHLDKYADVGQLRRAVAAADLQSTLQLPVACAFDCGARLLPATNEQDFISLMKQTNFGETLDTFSCNLPYVPVKNGVGQEVKFG